MTKKLLVSCFAAVVAVAAACSPLAAQVYSFEGAAPPDGFAANGGGTTVTQSTIGVTNGSNSLGVSVVGGATFVGALTGNVPAAIGDPPGIQSVLFDLTIPSGGEFTGGFAVVGVTIFGATQPGPGQQFGLPVQFADTEAIDGKAAGTYAVQIDLSSATHPTTFATGQSFNDIFGPNPGEPNDIIPTGFQLFFNKSNDAPLTVYIDNVRVVVPEPSTAMLLGVGALGLVRRRKSA